MPAPKNREEHLWELTSKSCKIQESTSEGSGSEGGGENFPLPALPYMLVFGIPVLLVPSKSSFKRAESRLFLERPVDHNPTGQVLPA